MHVIVKAFAAGAEELFSVKAKDENEAQFTIAAPVLIAKVKLRVAIGLLPVMVGELTEKLGGVGNTVLLIVNVCVKTFVGFDESILPEPSLSPTVSVNVCEP